MNIYTRLAKVQKELKAPKNQRNTFGNFDYRSCEDILTAAKPLCIENGLILSLTDRIEIKENRYYVVANAKVIDVESEKEFSVEACAREPESKKGMDESQITGAASSYARKYALNGLFCIDDVKDADSQNNQSEKSENDKSKKNEIDQKSSNLIKLILKEIGDDMSRLDKITQAIKGKQLIECSEKQLGWIYSQIKKNKL